MIHLPALMGIAGAVVALARLMVVAGHPHRIFVGPGPVLAAVTIAAPQAVSGATRTAVVSTSPVLSGLTGTTSRDGTVTATETVAVP